MRLGKRGGEGSAETGPPIRLPDTYVTKMLSSRYAQHFCTADERASIRLLWMKL